MLNLAGLRSPASPPGLGICGAGGIERVSSKIGRIKATVTVPAALSVPNPACFITFKPTIGPIDIARLVDRPK
ncbi:hypothetical protein D1872_270270 [compost metagenome]